MNLKSEMEELEAYLIVGVIAAHANHLQTGFRQKDVKFLMEFFSNWMDFTLRETTAFIHNTQVMRYLNDLTKEGWAKVESKSGLPRYKLTAVGLASLVSRLVNRPPGFPLETFYFVFHFLETYRPPIEELLRTEAKALPPSVRVELDFLLDMNRFIDNQIRFLEHQIRKLKQRSLDSQEVTKIVRKFRDDKKITKDLVKEIEKKFPYDLNSQKPLSELYQEVPEKIQDFILDTGIKKRTLQIWVPLLKVMERHLDVLKEMKVNLKTAS